MSAVQLGAVGDETGQSERGEEISGSVVTGEQEREENISGYERKEGGEAVAESNREGGN